MPPAVAAPVGSEIARLEELCRSWRRVAVLWLVGSVLAQVNAADGGVGGWFAGLVLGLCLGHWNMVIWLRLEKRRAEAISRLANASVGSRN